MIKKVLRLLISGLMLVSLLMASCRAAPTSTASTTPAAPPAQTAKPAPASPTTPAAKEAAVVTGKEMVTDSLGKLVEKPKYGGTFNGLQTSDQTNWDEAFSSRMSMLFTMIVQETALIGDWAKGPNGSGEVGWRYVVTPEPSIMVGNLAESWEITDDETIVLHIRKGVHFQNKPPTNGREMDANDVAYSLMRVAASSKSFVGQTSKLGVDVKSITATDKWTVVFKSYPGKLFLAYYSHFIQGGSVIPREVVEKYGDMQDWRNLVGTGPFMLTDYVPGSNAKYVKNPSYWAKDPLHPENTLPYLDNLNYLIIPDKSTQMAALRTGKLDMLTNLQREDKEQFEKTNPKMLWERFLPLLDDMRWRVDTAPFSDLRVRRALWMAVDRQEMSKSLYKGDAEILAVATYPILETMRYYTPLDQLPPSAQELFKYNPDKAKTLLKEAGYPSGFKTEIITPTAYVDLWSVIKYYWAAVGVDLDLQVRDGAVLTSIINEASFKQIISRGGSEYRPESFTAYATGQNVNSVFPNDPIVDKARLDSSTTFMRDKAANAKLVKETLVRIIDQAYSFSPPKPYYYIGWQPWLKSYHGENVVGGRGNTLIYVNYVWIDQGLKTSMGR